MKLWVISFYCLLSLCILPTSLSAKNYQMVELEELWMSINRDSTIDVTEIRDITMHGKWGIMSREFLLLGCDDIQINELRFNNRIFRQGKTSKSGEYSLQVLGPRLHGKGSLAPRLEMLWRCSAPSDPPFNLTATRVVIKYRVTGAIGQYDEYDMLSWNPLRVYRRDFIRDVKVRVLFPEAVKPIKTTFKCNALNPRLEVSPGQRMISFTAQSVSPNDKFRFAVKFPKGVVDPYYSFNNHYYYNIKPWTLPVIVGLTLIILLLMFFMKGRDPKVTTEQIAAIKLNYIRPGMAGLVVDESFDHHDITATIIDLARRKILKINQISSVPAEYEIILKHVPVPGMLLKFEEMLLTEMFGGSLVRESTTDTRQLRYSFYRRIPRIRQAAWSDTAGWFSVSPQHARNIYLLFGLGIAATGIAMAAIKIPIAIFLALWCMIFGGIPIYRIIHLTKDNGWQGLRAHLVYLPLILLGAGVAVYSIICAYPWTNWVFDCGVAIFISGLLVVATGPAMAHRNVEGCILARRIRKVYKDLLNHPDEVTEMSACDKVIWVLVMSNGNNGMNNVPTLTEDEYRDFFHPLAGDGNANEDQFALMMKTLENSLSANSQILQNNFNGGSNITSAYANS